MDIRKTAITAAIALSGAAALSAPASHPLPQFPAAGLPDTEVAVHAAIPEMQANLKWFRIEITGGATATNEVAAAVGRDADEDGVLDWAEADVLIGCDCGEWYGVDLRTGEPLAVEGGALQIPKKAWDFSWNALAAVRRGLGGEGCSVGWAYERSGFRISIR